MVRESALRLFWPTTALKWSLARSLPSLPGVGQDHSEMKECVARLVLREAFAVPLSVDVRRAIVPVRE